MKQAVRKWWIPGYGHEQWNTLPKSKHPAEITRRPVIHAKSRVLSNSTRFGLTLFQPATETEKQKRLIKSVTAQQIYIVR